MCKILVVDDDSSVLNMIEDALNHEGYNVFKAHSGQEMFAMLETVNPDLFILDLSLPKTTGVDLCNHIRANPETAVAPIIFLTGHHGSYNVADALEAGGDDYVRKPFAVRELAARVRAHLRRSNNFVSDDTVALRIIPGTYQVFVDSKEIMLTRIEFDLLNFMCHMPNKWHGTQDLLTGVWNYPDGVGDAALVRNHIRNLRRKLEPNPDHPDIIQSRHGRGYSVRAHVEFADSPYTSSQASSSSSL